MAKLIYYRGGIPYQSYNSELAKTLREILTIQSSESFLVCLPDVFQEFGRYNIEARSFWLGHFARYKSLYKECCTAEWYGSTFLSRPYIDLEDKAMVKDYFSQLKELWKGRDILIVEGSASRSGVGNDLFEEAASICRIIGPSRDAYDYLEELKEVIREHGKNKLILLMLGPTAKVLSYQLSQEGYWTVDLGHIDSEYEWYRLGARHKVKLKHKHTAEHNYDQNIEWIEDKTYNQQIIAFVGVDEKKVEHMINLEMMKDLAKDSVTVLEDHELELISVIVPVFNVQKYLTQCVESILNQTYTNIEVLLINDGSTDDSGKICQSFAEKDTRVRLFQKANGGLSDSRNLGLENARGKYVTFIDSDDFIEPYYIERLYVEAVRHGVDIVVSDYSRLNEADSTFYFHTKDKYIRELTAQDYFDEIFKTETLAFVIACGKLIARDLFNGRFPIRFPVGRLAEDKHVTYLLAWKAQKIIYLHEPNYCYRIRPGSITTSQASLKRADDDLFGCEQRMLDLVLMGYDLRGAKDWYHYILEIHERDLRRNGLEHTELYQKITKKLALLTNDYK